MATAVRYVQGSPGILVVDADPATRQLLRDVFPRVGFESEAADDLGTALVRVAGARPAAVVLHDGIAGPQGVELLVLANAAAAALLGVAEPELVGRPVVGVFGSEESAALRSALGGGASPAPARTVRGSIRSADGERIPVSLDAAVWHDAAGRAAGMVGFLRDRRAAEGEQRRSSVGRGLSSGWWKSAPGSSSWPSRPRTSSWRSCPTSCGRR